MILSRLMDRMMLRIVLAGILVSAMTSGCGVYSFTPRGKSEIKSVAVQRFDNETAEYGLEDQITDQIVDALIADGTLKVVALDYADAVLSGTLTNYERRPSGFSETDRVENYKVTIGFNIVLIKAADESEIWNEKMSHYGVYSMDTETEDIGRQKAVELLVQDIINKTTKSW